MLNVDQLSPATIEYISVHAHLTILMYIKSHFHTFTHTLLPNPPLLQLLDHICCVPHTASKEISTQHVCITCAPTSTINRLRRKKRQRPRTPVDDICFQVHRTLHLARFASSRRIIAPTQCWMRFRRLLQIEFRWIGWVYVPAEIICKIPIATLHRGNLSSAERHMDNSNQQKEMKARHALHRKE